MIGVTENQPEAAVPSRASEGEPADFATLLSRAYELGEMIKQSALAAEYVYYKDKVNRDADVHALARDFAKAKERFAECERFGRFHPDYNEALDRVYELEARLEAIGPVKQYKEAEQAVDLLLHEVSLVIARAVSDSIKVPDNNPNPKGCGSGGKCSCGGGGCG